MNISYSVKDMMGKRQSYWRYSKGEGKFLKLKFETFTFDYVWLT